jgi:hypothetical protein
MKAKILRFFFIFILSLLQLNGNLFSGNILSIKINKIIPRDLYKVKVIKFFLNKSGIKYNISSLKNSVTKPREFKEIQKGKLINVGIFTSSKKYESTLIPIRFPIYKGLIGYRIFIINKKNQKVFEQVKSVEDLKKLICIQGLNWTDADILKSSGFNVYQTRYTNIFGMLELNHEADFFPRGIYEIFFEMDKNSKMYPNLTIEKTILLHYPLAMFLYVSPKTPEIAKALKKGFEIAQKDGSLKYLTSGNIIGNYNIKKIISLSRLKHRKIFELPNPFLTDETKKIPEEFWFKPYKITDK